MKKPDFTQLSFDFSLATEEASAAPAMQPFAKKVVYFAPYAEAKKQRNQEILHQGIFESIKHIV